MLIFISLAFFSFGVAGLFIATYNEKSIASICMCFVLSIVLFIGHFISKHERKKISEREFHRDKQEKEQEKVRNEIQVESLKRNISICDEINKKFLIPKCSKCNDIYFKLEEFNTQLDGIMLECKTCNKTFWLKSEDAIDRSIHEYYINDSIHTLSIFGNPVQLIANNTENQYQKRHNITSSVKRKVWNRDGGKCVKCGSRENLEYDHIIPVSKGGSNTARNIELLCEKCNRKKSANIG